MSLTVELSRGARIDWLPQEDHPVRRRRPVAAAGGGPGGGRAAAGVWRAVVLGRTAMGEAVRRGRTLRDRWRIRREGRLIFADDVALAGARRRRHSGPGAGAGRTGGPSPRSCWSAADADRFLVAPVAGGAGRGRRGQRLRRQAGLPASSRRTGFALRRVLLPALQILRDGAPCPRVWASVRAAT